MLLTHLNCRGLRKPSEILGTMFIAADCLGMNTKEDAMDLNGKKIAAGGRWSSFWGKRRHGGEVGWATPGGQP